MVYSEATFHTQEFVRKMYVSRSIDKVNNQIYIMKLITKFVKYWIILQLTISTKILKRKYYIKGIDIDVDVDVDNFFPESDPNFFVESSS